jgi:Kef-type K+ transport system membrane component KefB
MAVGLGFFGLVLAGLEADWKAGIVAGVIASLAAVAFGVVMRMMQARKQRKSK